MVPFDWDTVPAPEKLVPEFQTCVPPLNDSPLPAGTTRLPEWIPPPLRASVPESTFTVPLLSKTMLMLVVPVPALLVKMPWLMK